MHAFAAQGYVVAAVNYHGSSGFDERFLGGIIDGDLGHRELADTEAVTDALIGKASSTEAPLRRRRQLWRLHGRLDERPHRSLQGLRLPRWRLQLGQPVRRRWLPVAQPELGCWPWEDLEKYQSQSPHTFSKNFKTPTLVIHGELDYRVPYYEGLEYYNTLRAKGIPSRLVVYPDENHWILAAEHQVEPRCTNWPLEQVLRLYQWCLEKSVGLEGKAFHWGCFGWRSVGYLSRTVAATGSLSGKQPTEVPYLWEPGTSKCPLFAEKGDSCAKWSWRLYSRGYWLKRLHGQLSSGHAIDNGKRSKKLSIASVRCPLKTKVLARIRTCRARIDAITKCQSFFEAPSIYAALDYLLESTAPSSDDPVANGTTSFATALAFCPSTMVPHRKTKTTGNV